MPERGWLEVSELLLESRSARLKTTELPLMNASILNALLIYLGLFMIGTASLVILRIKMRKTRPPMDFKLLRAPGETLRRKMAQHDDTMFLRILLAALVPLIAGCLALYVAAYAQRKFGISNALGWSAIALVFVAALIPTVRWAIHDLEHFRAYRLGYLGERAVGDQLVPLIAQGYAVFHDIPANGGKKPFNLDHVAVGPTGVALVETKTRRKGRARPGFKDHEVTYDGHQLIWPWGEDRHGLEQAFNEAEWLRKWIQQRTGIDTPVKPILALPGWFVVSKVRGAVTVVNHKQVPSAVRGNNGRILSDDQVDLIARQLDLICRDVED